MSWKFVSGRRVSLMLLFAAIGGALFSWRRRTSVDRSGPPEWPPLPDPPRPGATADEPADEPATGGSDTPVAPDEPAGADAPEPASEAGADEPAAPAEPPEATGAEPEAGDADRAWVDADEAGACPTSHPIKAKDSSNIFHVPGGRFYDRTNADRCYASGDAAESDGYRQSKS